jgi:competence protein ComEC
MINGSMASKRTPLHLPLSRYFLPQVCAYIVANKLALPLLFWLILSVFSVIVASVIYRLAGNAYPHARRLAMLALCLSCFGAYYEWRQGDAESRQPITDYPWPPSEVSIELEVEQLWANSGPNRIAGVGKILNAPVYARVSIGERMAFDALSDTHWQQTPWIGSRILVRGVRTAMAAPEDYDSIAPFGQWLIEQGIPFHLRQATVREVYFHAQPSWAERMNEQLESQLRKGLPEDSSLAGVYVAMLLGKRVALSEQQLTAFRETGTMHFFAISGLHIKVIAATVFFLLAMLRLPRIQGMVVGLCILALYVYVTGSSPSAVRAFLMVFFFWIGVGVSHRQNAPMAAWMNAALIVLLIDPANLFLIGFQLSYAVVASIFLFGLPLSRALNAKLDQPGMAMMPESSKILKRLLRWLTKITRGVMGVFCVGLAAWLASTPLTLWHFNLLVPGAVLLNIPLLLLCSSTLVSGVLSLVSGLLGLAFVGQVFNFAAVLFLWLMTLIVDTGHATWLAGSELERVWPTPAVVGLVGFLFIAWWQEKQLSKDQPERRLRSFLIPFFLLALCCAIAIVAV